MKISRSGSFLIVAAVYVLAAVCGYWVFGALEGPVWSRVLLADIAATVLVFVFSCLFNNASVYDPYWSVQPIVILAPMALINPNMSKLLLLAMVCIWGIRLTGNWAYTFTGMDHQDWRYTQLKETSGKLYPFVNLAGTHMFPTLVVFLCVLPAISVMQEAPAFTPLCLLGFCISIGAVMLQLVADTQMHNYRKDRRTPFVEVGLWKNSRHPNYLGEIMMWWGVAVYSVCLLGFRWYLILGALVNNLMFLFISIPMADKRQAKKLGYEEYCRGKNCLIPIRFGKADK